MISNANEVWKPIVGYEDRYAVSNLGRVMSTWSSCWKRGGILCTYLNNRKYILVRLYKDNGSRFFSVHRLVALAFVPKLRADQTTVNHIDGDKNNNSSVNLEWATVTENIRHAINTGLRNINGERNGQSVLNDAIVLEMRKRHAQGYDCKSLSKMYGFKHNAVWSAITGRSWKHLPMFSKIGGSPCSRQA